MPVAIIGIGCRFPGAVDSADSFWRFLIEGRDAIAEIPSDRIDLAHFFDPRPATPGRIMTRWGGYLDGIDQFDAEFFGISPREAERLDPQQRLVLETAWEALEDAGQCVPALAGSRTGVFLGQWLSDFEARLFADPERADFLMTTGSGRYATSGRVSFLLGLQGPSLTLDTACSSSLVAVHLAARSIRDGESELALAGGVNVILQPHISVAYSQSRMMAPDGRCKFGDASGDGYVRSEGAGIIVLKALERALADGDRIYAVIRGGAINNDGRCSGSMGTPARAGQEALLRTAYADAGISPGSVGYIEAHGTGTRAGDPVELGALGAVLAGEREPGQRARVGSVKTNFGHTEGAAGVAGLIKLALCLHHHAIPASLNCRELNPAVPWDELPVELARSATPWDEDIRVGGVSAFGIAGTNAHIVLQSAPPAAAPAVRPAARAWQLLPVSARSPAALRELASRYAQLVESLDDVALVRICGEAAHRRGALEYRAAFIGTGKASMQAALAQYAAGEPAAAEGMPQADRPRIAFIVPGQGAQWIGMARELLETEPLFGEAIDRCNAAARRYVDWSIREQIALDPGATGYLLDRIDVIQPVLVALAIGYADWLAAQGIRPDAVVGHSMGEVGSACIAGVLDLDAAMRIICRRSALMREQSGRGVMAMVDLSIADAEARIGERGDRVSVAVSNSPRSTVISGDPDVVSAILAECESDGVFCRRVNVDVASHSPQMEEAAARLRDELHDLVTGADRIALYSTVQARRAAGKEFGAGYWATNLRRPVRFADTIAAMLSDGISVFVELGPHPVLLPAVQQTAQAAGATSIATIGCGRREEPEQRNLLIAAMAAWAAGAEVDWHALQPRIAAIELPHYPWQRERHWVQEARQRHGVQANTQLPAGLEDSLQAWLCQLRWIPDEASPESASAPQQWLVLGSDEPFGAELAKALVRGGADATQVRAGDLAGALAADNVSGAHRGIIWIAGSSPSAAWELVETAQLCAASAASARLWAVTRGGQSVPGESVPVDVNQGALWGAGRVIAQEHPEFWGALIDADPRDCLESQATQVASELLRGTTLRQITLRRGIRHKLSLQELDVPSIRTEQPWRAEGAYLITGGLGDIGLRVAAAMVQQGARRLLLMGRTCLPPRDQWQKYSPDSSTGRRIAGVRALEAAGAAIHLLQADVGDAAALERALAQYAVENWPPIIGVVHAAGITENSLLARMTRPTFERVMTAKLTGAQHLDRLFPDVEQFILFSSISAALGSAGMVNYAAANAGLDALAQARRARGARAQSVQWGPWKGTGLFASADAETNREALQRQGIGSFTPEQGVEIFGWLAASGLDAVTVMPVDWNVLDGAVRGPGREIFESRLRGHGDRASVGTSDLAGRLKAAESTEQRRSILETLVRDTAAKVLGVAAHRIDVRRPLGAMGLGSLLAMELRNRLEAAVDQPLSASLTWNYPTVEQIARFLNGEAAGSAQSLPANHGGDALGQEHPLQEDMQQIAALSDDDALHALLGGGKGG